MDQDTRRSFILARETQALEYGARKDVTIGVGIWSSSVSRRCFAYSCHVTIRFVSLYLAGESFFVSGWDQWNGVCTMYDITVQICYYIPRR